MSKRPEGTGVPLVGFPCSVTRADNTPLNEREKFPNMTVDKNGIGIPDPHKDADKMAFETNPTLMLEHWYEYWRKIHGAKITYKESADDSGADLIATYNQVHRIASGPSSLYAPPYKAPLAADGKITSTPAAEVRPYKRPKYDGVTFFNCKSISDFDKFFASDKYIKKIMPDEAIFCRYFIMSVAAEYIIIPGPAIPDPIVLVKIFYRKSGTREDFQNRLLWNHADFVYSKPDVQKYVTRYSLNLNIGPSDKNSMFYQEAGQKLEATSAMSFRNMTECEIFLSGDDYRSIEAIENEFVDQEQSEWFTGINYLIVNNVGKEVATNRNIRPKI